MLLREEGGVFVDEGVVLTEDLSWLDTVDKSEFMNGKLGKKPAVFGFGAV